MNTHRVGVRGWLLLGVSCASRTGFFSRHRCRWKETHPGPPTGESGRAGQGGAMYPEHSVMRWDLPNEDLQRTRVRRLCPRSSSRVTASLSQGVGGSQGWGRGGAEQCWPEGWMWALTWGWVTGVWTYGGGLSHSQDCSAGQGLLQWGEPPPRGRTSQGRAAGCRGRVHPLPQCCLPGPPPPFPSSPDAPVAEPPANRSWGLCWQNPKTQAKSPPSQRAFRARHLGAALHLWPAGSPYNQAHLPSALSANPCAARGPLGPRRFLCTFPAGPGVERQSRSTGKEEGGAALGLDVSSDEPVRLLGCRDRAQQGTGAP